MVTIITVNYNGYADTCELIKSLENFENYPYQLIIIDNASPNGDGIKLKKQFPHLDIICSKCNLGFAGANNLGYKYAKGEYILYMNNDMKIYSPFIEKLVLRINSSSLIGLVSPKIKFEHSPEIIQDRKSVV